MVISEFDFLTSNEATALIDKHISDNPLQLALKGIDGAICTQVKYLQRCRAKLPHYYNARCIIPSISYEQSSSAATAAAKKFSGNVCVDLTCGLGADSFWFSKRFKRVISVERDELLCKVAEYNFKRLGASNIEVMQTTAQEFLENYTGNKIDMIYIDPARRDQNKKVFLLEDCSPDMNAILPLALKHTSKLVIKLSPMFDIDAAHSFFSSWGSITVSSVSYDRECKEVLVTVEPTQNKSQNCATIIKDETFFKSYSYNYTKEQNYSSTKAEGYKYLYIPNISFYKSRTINSLMQQTYNCTDYYLSSPNAPVLSNTLIEYFEGDSYKITEILPYKPKELKKLFKRYGGKAKILKKEFPEKTELIKKELSISDGELPIVLLTICRGKKEAIFLTENY